MSELIDFLRARLDEDQEAAAELDGESWSTLEDGDDRYNYAMVTMSNTRLNCGVAWHGGEHLAAHIARHDPARVLADVAAKRAIVELHHADAEYPGHECAIDDTDPSTWIPDGKCRTLLLLAQPYVDHPGFRDEWRTTLSTSPSDTK